MDKRLKKIFMIIIAIIYMGLFALVTFKYIHTNRYWNISGFDASITAEAGEDVLVNARVQNEMYYVLGSGENYFLSYHLYSEDGTLIQYDNPRTDIKDIRPGQAENIDIKIKAPVEKGRYIIKIDIVKEGEYWFENRGEKPGVLNLTVI